VPPTDAEALLKAFHAHTAAFVVIGGAAAVLQGSAYVTNDLDICYSREKSNLGKIAEALAPFNPSLRGAPEGLNFRLDVATPAFGLNFTLSTDAGAVDLLGEVAGLGGYAEVLSLSEEMIVFGMPSRVLTLEGLIKSKHAAGRTKDLLILPELEALLKIKKKENA
jgi:hypothetical protein